MARKNPRGFSLEPQPERRRCTTEHTGIYRGKSGKPSRDYWKASDAPQVQDEPAPLPERRRLLRRKRDDTRTASHMRPRPAGRVCNQGVMLMIGNPAARCSSLNDQQRVANMLDAARPRRMLGFGECAPYEIPGNELWCGYADGHKACRRLAQEPARQRAGLPILASPNGGVAARLGSSADVVNLSRHARATVLTGRTAPDIPSQCRLDGAPQSRHRQAPPERR